MANPKTYKEKWAEAKLEAMAILIDTARRQSTITYSALCDRITSLILDPHTEIKHLLGELSTDSHKQGCGLLSSLVVHKEDMAVGEGFFELAKSLGYEVRDKDEFWLAQMRKVWLHWAMH